MKKILLVLFIGFLFLVSGCATNYNRLLYNKRPAFYSYIFGDVQGNHISSEHYADVYTTPASCQKTISALLAYKTLGANYRYETKLYVTKKNHKIHDLIISFAGDPTLKSEDLIQLLEPVYGANITGRIFLDASLFKTPPHSPNLMINDLGTDDAPPVSSINIDHNLIIITALPNKKTGKPAILTNDSGYPIDSDVTTTLKPSSVKLSIHNNRIMAHGNINANDNPVELRCSPIDLNHYILYKISNIIKRAKIKAKVTIVRNQSHLPKKLILLKVNKSEPLNRIIPPALKISDNFVFDNLYLKIIDSQNSVGIEDWNEGDKIIRNLIYKYFGIDMTNSMFVDGSGLSRYNRVQPRKLFEILKKGYYVDGFSTALAAPGEPNSTLLKRTDLAKSIRAKTGNISGVSCLCGYSINKHPKAFVIITNSFASPNKDMFPILDNFVNHCLDK